MSNTALNFYAYFVCGCCIELFGDAVSEPSRSFQTSNNPEGKGLRTVLRVHCRASEIPWVQQAGLSFKFPDLSGWFSNPPGAPFSNPVSLLPEDFLCKSRHHPRQLSHRGQSSAVTSELAQRDPRALIFTHPQWSLPHEYASVPATTTLLPLEDLLDNLPK